MWFSRNLHFPIGQKRIQICQFSVGKNPASGPGKLPNIHSDFSSDMKNEKNSFGLAHQVSGHPIFIRTLFLFLWYPFTFLVASFPCRNERICSCNYFQSSSVKFNKCILAHLTNFKRSVVRTDLNSVRK